ncbi:AraC family transcriptional regulator [Aureibacter tunicatorum]|uniref:AraC-like DNA-binding protein n=1 Tax=Aureibacter tunicatorum TaxID=866807 RepID=A0AAE3XMV8_9BACT|nr:helix-turn-helix transcriptional regulator [Aureibacter tunicatorum]MDR6238829.1 AraC-like DNA-binding protein [Aureibacter tunicatorum]BDD05244.1 hypothetical protein AUTU_27270 [Aureibacter tunicatorum]
MEEDYIKKVSLGSHKGLMSINMLNGEPWETFTRHGLSPHRHEYFQLICLQDAKGTHLIEDKVFPILPGAVFLILPHQIHHLQAEGKVKGFVINFSEMLLADEKEYAEALAYSPDSICLYLNEKDREIMYKECELLCAYYEDQDNEDRLKLCRLYIQILLTKINRWRKSNEQNTSHSQDSNYALLNDFISLVKENFDQKKKLEFYAHSLGVSVRKLSGLIKMKTGFPPAQFIEKFIAQEAARRLHYSDQSIKEIAMSLGFTDLSYFTKVFKKHFEITPQSYRNKVKG